MQLHNSATISEIRVHVNPGQGDPFAILTLGNDLRIQVDSPADADQLIAAAVDAKRKLTHAISGDRHEFRDDGHVRCDCCGQLERDPVHDTAAAQDAPVVVAMPDGRPAPLPAPCGGYSPAAPYGPCTTCGRTRAAHELAATPARTAS